ncbi:MAG TPA: PAS domain S-box protein [Terracidiphilus sp.]|nr:PAS domain S-box protein [Terracidiphilus sp.]
MPQVEERQTEISPSSGWLPEELHSSTIAPGLLRALFEGHPDMVAITDDHGRIVGGNSRLLEEFGYSRQDLDGQPVSLLLPEDARARHEREVRGYQQAPSARAMGSGIDLKARDAHGEHFSVDVMLWPFTANGHAYVMAVCRRLNAMLVRSHMHVRALVESVRDYAIQLLDSKGRILTWNEGSRRLHGLTATEALGRPLSILFSPEEAERGEPARLLEEAAREGRHRTEGWRSGAEGRRAWVETDLTAIRDGAGHLTGFTRVVHDLTEHRLSVENLRKLNLELEQYRVVLENIDEHAIYTLDAKGRVTGWGTGAQKMLGYSAEEALGQPYAIFATLEDRRSGGPERELAEAAASGRCCTDSWRLRRDGTLLWTSGVLSAVKDECGALMGFVRVARDRTEEKMFADAREQVAAELEDSVAERTRQLQATVEELRRKSEETEAQAELVSRNLREKEVLLREIHHRVKNNLQVVQSLLKMRARLLPEGEMREAFETTVERVNAMALLHERLYQMPHIEGISLSNYLRDLFRDLFASTSLEPGQVHLRLHADDIPLELELGVPFGLLMNELLSNSLKHAFPDGRKGNISLTVRRIEGAVRLIIRDDGRGLPENFNPAASASMGLKLAASLARQLGGALEFSNDGGCRVQGDLRRM